MCTVLFTGGGASHAIGYPLTRDLFPTVLDELKSHALFAGTNGKKRDARDRRLLKDYLGTLFLGLDRITDGELPLITDVFSLVEHSILSQESLPIGGSEHLRRFRDLLKHAITDILLGGFLAPWKKRNKRHQKQRQVLHRLAEWMVDRGGKAGLVTTNYDIGLEYEIYKRVERDRVEQIIDLGFDWRDPVSGEVHVRPANPGLRVYKLHGSLDQLRCPLCGHVYFNGWGSIAVEAFREKLTRANTCHCHPEARLELNIVAPSHVRDMRESNLLGVWRSALEWLRSAERWIIAGYAMPPEDLATRSLMLRAYATAKPKPEIRVVQRGTKARALYKLLFPKCRYDSRGLEQFVKRLDREG